ncbi:helix-turn-helix domain-containing protein [Actinokineospora alba]|uniref:helix-turn-helix domain-containing protein n=1 Tax=Actinokineospora alba TaxID=504798 RepID=UPI001E3660B0|nr:helix-turn-helix domain-containing protein [Actinokineospora alba]
MPEINHTARPTFFTVKEATEILRVGASTLYRVIREDGLPAVRLRSRYVIPPHFWTGCWRKSPRQMAWLIQAASRRSVE